MDATFSNIKAVFCDIDGTLLTSEHTVSPRTVAAIRALRERGVLFGWAPGATPTRPRPCMSSGASTVWWT